MMLIFTTVPYQFDLQPMSWDHDMALNPLDCHLYHTSNAESPKYLNNQIFNQSSAFFNTIEF
jgi:hypothetical protein